MAKKEGKKQLDFHPASYPMCSKPCSICEQHKGACVLVRDHSHPVCACRPHAEQVKEKLSAENARAFETSTVSTTGKPYTPGADAVPTMGSIILVMDPLDTLQELHQELGERPALVTDVRGQTIHCIAFGAPPRDAFERMTVQVEDVKLTWRWPPRVQ